MSSSKLHLASVLRQGRKADAAFAVLKGVRPAQVMAHVGLDAVFIDCEHGYIGDTDMHDMVSAVAGSGISPVIRVKDYSGANLKRALDTGTHGILVPMIHSAADFKEVVRLSKYPPLGVRGQGSPFACFEHGLATPADYVRAANDQVLLMAQIESAQGLANIEEICQVDGLDMVIIGPNDLALALLGYLPAKETDTVYHDAVTKIVETAHKYGKKAGLVVVDGQGAKAAKERFDLVVLSNDVRALQAWYRRELQISRS